MQIVHEEQKKRNILHIQGTKQTNYTSLLKISNNVWIYEAVNTLLTYYRK